MDLSIVIPFFNRGATLPYTLESVRRARLNLGVEVILVDDGSTPSAAEQFRKDFADPDRILRQDNQGLLFARLAGLNAARGEYLLFLDSDDLVSPDKLRLQLAAMSATGAAVSYTDQAHAVLEGDYDSVVVTADPPLHDTTDATEFFICVQPAPHAPIFRTDYLRQVVNEACFPPSPLYNSVAEIWFYQNAAPQPGQVVRVPGPHTIVGRHPGVRLTDQWERLGVASLAVMEGFARGCTLDTPTARRARHLLGTVAFRSWRALPRGFSHEFERRELALWRRLAPDSRLEALGGRTFQRLARWLGAERAARLLKLVQAPSYESIRTLDNESFQRLLGALPPE